ncbi:L,D-transpeptidase [Ramlibacter aquaticus]|uniref:L,D-transpeptidase n=1 Tax=Ramlibacter aquaticus TaxID=2780094 RepID=A0ABR9S9I6_9BURK|nr:L,D-transpeptidase [Ramlibacter aquaticus]
MVLGAVTLALVLPPLLWHQHHQAGAAATASALRAPARPLPSSHVASFGGQAPSTDVRRLVDWVAQSGDNGQRAFVVIDKKQARVWVFDPQARLQASAPAVLGAAHGDDTVPGIADKPLAQVRPEERTTPAGRFIAEPGTSASRGEDVVWVDYDAAVSMHRVIKAPERLAALATPDPSDNRLSYGCVNLPDAFYEQVLRPAVLRHGAVVYVLPETRGLAQTFAGYREVDSPVRLAREGGEPARP